MVDYTHYEIQTRQRLTTNALNDIGAYVGRMATEGLRRLVNAEAASVSGVLDGLLVTVNAGTMGVSVGGGLALLYDSVQVSPSNRHRWIEIDDAAPVVLTLDVGGVSPRWDVIEIAPGITNAPGEVLDVYNPQLGAPEAVVLSPLKLCRPVVNVTKGTPGANPKFPAGTAGRIPLAYVYVAAGAVALNTSRVVYCRPMLRPRGFSIAPNLQTKVQGGGWSRATGDTTGNLSAKAIGTFPNGAEFHLPAGAGYDLEAAGNYDGGGLPVANGNVYLYAAPPPYPSGYSGNLAPREIFTPDATIMGGTYVAGAYGAIIVISSVAPNRDHIGAPSTGGNSSIIDNLFGTVDIDRAQMVYLGCGYYNSGFGVLQQQTCVGAICSTDRVSGHAMTLPIAADTLVTMHTNVAADSTYRLPAHVRRVQVQGYHRLDAQGDITVIIKDAIGVNTGYGHRWTMYRSNVADDIANGINAWMLLNDNQELTINYADGNGTTASNILRVLQWEDPVLAAR